MTTQWRHALHRPTTVLLQDAHEYQSSNITPIHWRTIEPDNHIGCVQITPRNPQIDTFQIVTTPSGVIYLRSLLPEHIFPLLYRCHSNRLPCENIEVAQESAVQYLALEYIHNRYLVLTDYIAAAE